MKRKPERRYVWHLSKTGDVVDVVVIGTTSQAQAFCEKERLNAKAYYNLNFDDLDSPFIIHL